MFSFKIDFSPSPLKSPITVNQMIGRNNSLKSDVTMVLLKELNDIERVKDSNVITSHSVIDFFWFL